MLKKKVDEWQGEINITGVYAPCQTTIFGLSSFTVSGKFHRVGFYMLIASHLF